MFNEFFLSSKSNYRWFLVWVWAWATCKDAIIMKNHLTPSTSCKKCEWHFRLETLFFVLSQRHLQSSSHLFFLGQKRLTKKLSLFASSVCSALLCVFVQVTDFYCFRNPYGDTTTRNLHGLIIMRWNCYFVSNSILKKFHFESDDWVLVLIIINYYYNMQFCYMHIHFNEWQSTDNRDSNSNWMLLETFVYHKFSADR